MILDSAFFAWTYLIHYRFPPFQGGIIQFTLGILITGALIYVLCLLKTHPEKIPDFSRIPTFDGFPNPILARKIFWAAELIFIHVWVYYMWCNDWWHMSNAYWVEMYCYWWFTGYMFYRWRKNA